jgi:hypothetical protein
MYKVKNKILMIIIINNIFNRFTKLEPSSTYILYTARNRGVSFNYTSILHDVNTNKCESPDNSRQLHF